MKKLISLVLALILICGVAMTAYAANIDVGVSSDSVSAGDSLTITITLEEDIDISEGATMMQGELHYDGTVLEFVGVEKSDQLSNAAKHKKQDKVLFHYLSMDNSAVGFEAGVLVTVTFRAKTDIDADCVNTVLEFKNAYVQNAQGENVGDLTYTSSVSVRICREHHWVDGICTVCGAADPDYVTVLASGWSGYTTGERTRDGILPFSPTAQTLAGQCNMRTYWKVSGVLTLPWGEYADMITSVVIEEGIHDLGQMAFYEMPNLESVTLAESVTVIRNYTCKNSKALTSINLENVDYIREGAFYGCAALTDVTLSEGVVVEDWAFSRSGVTID